MMKPTSLTLIAVALLALFPANHRLDAGDIVPQGSINHVLLVSVDGMHALDLAIYIDSHPHSALARLRKTGIFYSQGFCSQPSDSFPGLLAMVTGGTPVSTGVYYDDSYDRALLPPLIDADGNPLGGSTPGTEVVYDESIDINPDALDGGGGINRARLPRNPANGKPVYPHSFLRVNTIFEVARAAGLRTAWSDKHPAYDLVNGPSGKGVDDLFNPEIASLNSAGVSTTDSVQATEDYDDIKVNAILHEIAGFDHTGSQHVGTPAIFGMNFQAVSVAQKQNANLLRNGQPAPAGFVVGGYADEKGTPSPLLEQALNHTEESLEKMLKALDARGLTGTTLFILSAKHGQSPIDRARLISGATGNPLGDAIANVVDPVAPLAQVTADDVGLLWLRNQGKTGAAVNALHANQGTLHIETIYWGERLKLEFLNPRVDSRTPDIIIQPVLGTIYTDSTKKAEEHGGFTVDDTNVVLLVSTDQLESAEIKTKVQTTQIAPTILRALGLNPRQLRAIQVEYTPVLPGLFQ